MRVHGKVTLPKKEKNKGVNLSICSRVIKIASGLSIQSIEQLTPYSITGDDTNQSRDCFENLRMLSILQERKIKRNLEAPQKKVLKCQNFGQCVYLSICLSIYLYILPSIYVSSCFSIYLNFVQCIKGKQEEGDVFVVQ